MRFAILLSSLAFASVSACPREKETVELPRTHGSSSAERSGAHAPPSNEELLVRLRQTLGVTITSDGQDAEHLRLAERVASGSLLVGLRKEEIEHRLGPGRACGSPWPCLDGLHAEDWYYEVGRLRDGSVGGTPVLLVDFDPSGTCIATRVVHTQ